MPTLKINTLGSDMSLTKDLMDGKETIESRDCYMHRKEMMNEGLRARGFDIQKRNNPYSLAGPAFFATKETPAAEVEAERKAIKELTDTVNDSASTAPSI